MLIRYKLKPDCDKWYVGKIIKKLNSRSYRIRKGDGGCLVRNRIHLRTYANSPSENFIVQQNKRTYVYCPEMQNNSNSKDDERYDQSGNECVNNDQDEQYPENVSKYGRPIRPPDRLAYC